MLHDFYDMKQNNTSVVILVHVWLWTEALSRSTATKCFNAATFESNVQTSESTHANMEGGVGRDTSNLFLTRHNDVNAWAKSESCYRK